jgi:hypothetical protein
VTVALGATLKFSRHASNSPVYLLATGPVLIEGVVDVSGGEGPLAGRGAGGPGGFEGGAPDIDDLNGGMGMGPGGGTGQTSGQIDQPGRYHDVYGTQLLMPLIGGSGGGGSRGTPGVAGWGGGGGGGAILIASDVEVRINFQAQPTVDGVITAHGGSGAYTTTFGDTTSSSPGSGGAIRIVAPKVAGNGGVDVGGGPLRGDGGGRQFGGCGRIRIDRVDSSEMYLRVSSPPNACGFAVSFGRFLQAMPDVTPTLDIVRLAGEAVQPDAELHVTLPYNSSPQRGVEIAAAGFPGTSIDFALVLTPDLGERTVQRVTLPLIEGAGQASVTATFPVNTRTYVTAWTCDAAPCP